MRAMLFEEFNNLVKSKCGCDFIMSDKSDQGVAKFDLAMSRDNNYQLLMALLDCMPPGSIDFVKLYETDETVLVHGPYFYIYFHYNTITGKKFEVILEWNNKRRLMCNTSDPIAVATNILDYCRKVHEAAEAIEDKERTAVLQVKYNRPKDLISAKWPGSVLQAIGGNDMEDVEVLATRNSAAKAVHAEVDVSVDDKDILSIMLSDTSADELTAFNEFAYSPKIFPGSTFRPYPGGSF